MVYYAVFFLLRIVLSFFTIRVFASLVNVCHCRCVLKKSGCRTPRIELEEMGPSFDLVLRRTHLASDDLYKLAHRKPKALKAKKKKNISHNVLGTKFGRVHMQKQDLAKLQTRKMKGLRKRRGDVVAEDQDAQAPEVVKVDS
ncbi:ribosome production factor 2 homolog [Notothenia coriiceps]|uniref:Ribosome production factor 2 homolog n=1 Tax=Notothenia coriiceps TaxID=8208 RepID=A0A6I9P4M7_9TELE|nr:PREDICTED: ribosome production factor 2 homolog [Notothenia coriiceps]